MALGTLNCTQSARVSLTFQKNDGRPAPRGAASITCWLACSVCGSMEERLKALHPAQSMDYGGQLRNSISKLGSMFWGQNLPEAAVENARQGMHSLRYLAANLQFTRFQCQA